MTVIDTIKVMTPDFELLSDVLTVPGYYYDKKTDSTVMFSKSVKSPEIITYGIKCDIKQNNTAFVQFSASSVSTGGIHNMRELSEENFHDSINTVGDILLKAGCRIDLFEADISRFDQACDIFTEGTFNDYIPILKALRFYERGKKPEYPDGLYKGILLDEFCCYNKGIDLEKKFKKEKMQVPGLWAGKNILRFENRVKTNKKFQEVYDMKTINDIINNFSHLKYVFKNKIIELFYYPEKTSGKLLPFKDNISSELERMKKISAMGRNSIKKHMAILGEEKIVEIYGSMETYWQAWQGILTPKNVRNQKKIFNKMREAICDITIDGQKSLLQELKEKLLNVA